VLQYSYLGVLVFVVLVTLPLELVLGIRVWRRPVRLVLAVLPGFVLFVLWDLYAIRVGHWDFDPAQTTGVLLPGNLPIEEVLFFLFIPIAGIMSLEAVRVVRRWHTGDGVALPGVPPEDEPTAPRPSDAAPARDGMAS
jgi:lycopene cyclase domain-containing protein